MKKRKKQQQNRKNVYQLQTAAILRAYKSITQSTAGKGK